jgi:hypothetical protein
MKKRITHGIVLLLSFALAGCAYAEAASVSKPWPTHAPEATPYVRVYDHENDTPVDESIHFNSIEELWSSIYEEFGHFYAKKDELEMFRSLPQDEPYSFVPHSARFTLDEGEAMRMARLFDELEGCEVKVIALHQLVDSLDDWGFLTVVTMTPARLFKLSEELDETFMFEQLHDGVRERFDIDYWPDGLYAETVEELEGYDNHGCFYFEDGVLEQLEKLDRDTVCDFALYEHIPGGWNRDGQSLIWLLRGREGIELSLYHKKNSLESLCVASMDLAHLSALSDTLPGRYLVKLADEEVLDVYDESIRFTSDGEVIER